MKPRVAISLMQLPRLGEAAAARHTTRCKICHSIATMFDIVRAFRGVERYEVVDGEHAILFPAALNRLQRQVLELLEVPASLYQ